MPRCISNIFGVAAPLAPSGRSAEISNLDDETYPVFKRIIRQLKTVIPKRDVVLLRQLIEDTEKMLQTKDTKDDENFRKIALGLDDLIEYLNDRDPLEITEIAVGTKDLADLLNDYSKIMEFPSFLGPNRTDYSDFELPEDIVHEVKKKLMSGSSTTPDSSILGCYNVTKKKEVAKKNTTTTTTKMPTTKGLNVQDGEDNAMGERSIVMRLIRSSAT